MNLTQLNTISPIDGRYRSKVASLAEYFSEEALIKYRIKIEVEYFIALCELPLPQLADFNKNLYADLRKIYQTFSTQDALKVKELEKQTNHDVKAVEYFVKQHFDALHLQRYKEFIHLGLTSQDLNNTAIPLSLKNAMENVYYPALKNLVFKLTKLADDWKNIPMLARTHGQPASPTRLGKEFLVFVKRIDQQLLQLQQIPYSAKFGGATGNYNAHKVAYPNIDWKSFGTHFVEKTLGLHHSFPTTQIEHYDNLAALFDGLKRINNILIDFNIDIWIYISNDYFKQKIKKEEVGSSAMPHKVNPIDFENSEGNLGMSNAIFEHLSAKLPISRLQRDLTDSTVLRNLGVPFAHTLIGFNSSLKGLNKLVLNKQKLDKDLENNWAVVAEAIQTILRREVYAKPYETLKNLSRTHKKLDQKSFADFIDSLELSEKIKDELKAVSPFNYTGI
ncbi:MAG: adenylosuccinate lyase [Tenacibaculum sp.]